MNSLTDNSIFDSCRILFGHEADISNAFLCYLQPSGVKAAFRQKALLTHPDRHIMFDEQTRKKYTDEFIEADRAYKLLIGYLKKRDNATLKKSATEFGTRPSNSARDYGKYYSGPLPSRRLLWGEFLYFSGRITWLSLIEAIVWQRKQRPRFGEIAKRWGYLCDRKAALILAKKRPYEKIGETAVRVGLLNLYQVNAVLFYQKLKQEKIGGYFIKKGCLTEADVNALFEEFKRHNGNMGSPFSGRC
ncbi:MAG: hypothetical protein EPN22_08675 [Nitrospirae bacterium]|nr:MAG: hypothetical protein EPN22_08675 [Nitrospirota bacterium]